MPREALSLFLHTCNSYMHGSRPVWDNVRLNSPVVHSNQRVEFPQNGKTFIVELKSIQSY